MIKSVSYNQHEIIKSILALYCDGDIELDPTFGRGGFYKHGIALPKFRFDINPKTIDTDYGNAESLPFPDASLKTIIFDPPFLATTGKSLEIDNGRNIINRKFGVYPNEIALHTFYVSAMKELYRILVPGGILIFKCQDKISSGKQYMTHSFIIQEAMKIGFYVKDLFVLVAKNRLVANWQLKNQKHSRKYHCYFLVLEKSDRRVQYI